MVLVGVTGPDYVFLMLESLALLAATPPSDPAKFVDSLAGSELPPGPILVVSAYPSGVADELAGRLHRPVARLNVSTGVVADFFERAPLHAT